jgi:hypothetical protein
MTCLLHAHLRGSYKYFCTISMHLINTELNSDWNTGKDEQWKSNMNNFHIKLVILWVAIKWNFRRIIYTKCLKRYIKHIMRSMKRTEKVYQHNGYTCAFPNLKHLRVRPHMDKHVLVDFFFQAWRRDTPCTDKTKQLHFLLENVEKNMQPVQLPLHLLLLAT